MQLSSNNDVSGTFMEYASVRRENVHIYTYNLYIHSNESNNPGRNFPWSAQYLCVEFGQ